jgi:diguanylate cyclase (GGDEF)-like protein
MKPDIVLCDERMLADPAMQRIAISMAGASTGEFVLLAQNPVAVTSIGEVAVAATLALDTPLIALKESMVKIVGARLQRENPDAYKPVVASLDSRFAMARNYRFTHAAPSDLSHRQPLDAAPDQSQPATGATPISMQPQADDGRRHASIIHNKLTMRLSEVQAQSDGERDAVTGLPNSRVLGRALQTLTDVGYPSAIVVIHLWYASATGTELSGNELSAVLRSASASLLANVRQQDVVCRIDSATFAVVLPGVVSNNQTEPVERIRHAVASTLRKYNSASGVLHAATGVGYWTAPQSATQPLESAWGAMIQELRSLAISERQ